MCESTTSTFNKEKAVEGSSANIVKTLHMDVRMLRCCGGVGGISRTESWTRRPVCSGPSLAQPRPASAGLYSLASAGPGPGQTTITIILHINSIPAIADVTVRGQYTGH